MDSKNQIIGRIVEICDPLQLFVFGSVAKGVADDYSDLDLFVVVDDSSDIHLLLLKLEEAGLREDNDIVIRKFSEFEKNKYDIEKIDLVVNLDGKLVYEREG